MRWLSIFFLAVSFSALVAWSHPEHAGMVHLKFNDGKIHAHCTWQKGPSVGQDSILKIEWKNGASHVPVDPPGAVTVALATSGATIDVKPARDDGGKPIIGSYLAGPIEFTKPGESKVSVTLKTSGGAPETRAIEVKVSDATSGAK